MKVLKTIVPVALVIGTYFLIVHDILIVWSALVMCISAAILLKQIVEHFTKPKN